MVVSIILVGVLLPIGLVELSKDANWMYNSTTSLWDALDSGATLKTLVLTVMPILIVIGILMYYIPKSRD